MSGILYIVSTPIGNLKDITRRAVEVLQEVEAVVAEDTRRTLKLLNHLGIKKRLISYYGPVETQKTPSIVKMLKGGRRLALVSDAGTPLLSDPGYHLVKTCIKEGIKVVPIPGPSAVLAALVASGLPPHPFIFYGFLPKQSERIKVLKELSNRKETLVFFESPYRIEETLKDALEILGDRRCCIAREITKVHEEFIRGRISQVLEQIKEREVLGEICLVIEGAKEEEPPWKEAALNLLREGFSSKDVAKIINLIFKTPRNRVYKELIE